MSVADQILEGAELAAKLLPEPAATIAGLALKAGAAFAEAGKDPVVEITRVLSAANPVAEVLEERSDALDDKFGPAE